MISLVFLTSAEGSLHRNRGEATGRRLAGRAVLPMRTPRKPTLRTWTMGLTTLGFLKIIKSCKSVAVRAAPEPRGDPSPAQVRKA